MIISDNKKPVSVYTVVKISNVSFSELKKHDIFSLEQTGEVIKAKQPSLFKASSNAYLDEDSVYKIDCDPYVS